MPQVTRTYYFNLRLQIYIRKSSINLPTGLFISNVLKEGLDSSREGGGGGGEAHDDLQNHTLIKSMKCYTFMITVQVPLIFLPKPESSRVLCVNLHPDW